MASLLIATLLAPLALQAATQEPLPAPATLAELPIAEATFPRCGIAFATLEGWQKSGDPRGRNWPDMATSGGREFFVVAMARLMDARGLTREDIERLVVAEVASHEADNGNAVEAMMPACMALLRSSGLLDQ